MTRQTNPQFDGSGSPEVRALLDAGISEEVDYDVEKGLATHLAAVGFLPAALRPANSAGAGGGQVATTLSSKALLALIGVPVASASVVAALWLGSNQLGHRASPAVSAPVVAQTSAPGVVASPEPTAAAPAATAASTPSVDVGEPRNSAHVRRPGAHQKRPETVTLTESAEVPSAPAATAAPAHATHDVGAADAPTGTLAAEPVTSAPAAAAPTPVSATQANPHQPPAKPDDTQQKARLTREMDELVEAKRALSDDPHRALRLAEAGEREFPHGIFREEREHILLLAMIAVGRVDDARRLAGPYLQRYPDSPFARRVQRALAAATH